MIDREKEIKRLHDVAWDTGLTLDQILGQKKSPDISVDAVLHGLERNPTNVAMLYKFIANATELSASTRQRLCWEICEPYLRSKWSKEAVVEFQQKHPLKDDFNPDFINVSTVEQRIEQSGLLVNVLLNIKFAFNVLRTALGDPEELTEEDVQQLYYAICRRWKDDLDGPNRTDFGEDNNPLSAGLRFVLTCIIVIANTKNLENKEPADFKIMEGLLVLT